MKERRIARRPVEDVPDIPQPYRRQNFETPSFPKNREGAIKRRAESEAVSVASAKSNGQRADRSLCDKRSQKRRDTALKLLAQMYENDGKETTDAFLLETIRSF